ncbi:phosphatase PAP2 family protein [Kutzneria sp. NPDC052558]|uniref:phosphatase PAP2 family protein n=1 Tax=Kutzneria sp. NPDC052558 TaxID=3364121 RepID=UPI0037CBB954
MRAAAHERFAQVSDYPARRWLRVAVVSAFVAVAVYVFAVLTPVGQMLENGALRGADQVTASEVTSANKDLNDISVYSLAVAVAVVALIGLLRRRWALSLAAVGVIVAGQVVTQGLKRFVLPRPPLVPVSGHYAANSLPSGHTTIAMTVLFAALLVVPYRWRGVAMFFGMTWALGIGALTVTAKWHRVSDTLAADAIALSLACLASWWLARRGMVRRHDGRRRTLRVLFVLFMGALALAALALGAVFLWSVLAHGGLGANQEDFTWLLYLTANLLASFGSSLAALVFLGTWRRLEIP